MGKRKQTPADTEAELRFLMRRSEALMRGLEDRGFGLLAAHVEDIYLKLAQLVSYYSDTPFKFAQLPLEAPASENGEDVPF